MAIAVVRVNGYPAYSNYREFMIDTVDDVQNLPTHTKPGKLSNCFDNRPCAFGSTALVCGNDGITKVFILSPLNIWVTL